tara:strand:- start:13516 stop:13926 length:411 start_codon:yes stop_codon:yes gene_type:complete
VKIKNEKLYKKLNTLIDQFCEDDDLNFELSNDLIDLDFEAHICNVNLENLIKTSPTFYNEIIKFENKKLFCEFELSLSEILDKDELTILTKEVSNLYIEACDSDKRLIDLIKLNEDLHFRLNNLKKIGSKNEQSNI